jgi:hypothetical protein
MGAPTSAVLVETYIQNMEHKQIYPILIKHQIVGYFRYVDDILMIYNQRITNIEEILMEFNKQQPKVKFTMEKEQHNSINFLDITMHLRKGKVEFAMYRKHTHTDIIIPDDSCHPQEHRTASINYLMNRLHTYPITNKAKNKKLNVIKNTLHNNRYNIHQIKKHMNTIQTPICNIKEQKQNGPHLHIAVKKQKTITRLFKKHK